MHEKVRILASTRTWMEGAAVDQLRKTADLPGMKLAAGLPDLHPGKGSPIGAAFLTEGRIYPALVGNDVGCGIGLWSTGLDGSRIRAEAWAARLRGLETPWDGDAAGWLADRATPLSGHEQSLGTIGGGNHFAEVQAVERLENGAACRRLGVAADGVYLCVHSGSRGFGEAILREHVERFAAAGLPAESEDASRYLERHRHAVSLASANRELIAARLLQCLDTSGRRLVDLCHNSVERLPEGWLHRKGAAPSTAGPVLIPGSRGAFTYLVMPVEPGQRSAWSVAHGAGRKWSRSDSRGRLEKRFSAKDLARTALKSYVICENRDLLYEEAPQAYKSIDAVIQDLVDLRLAEVIAVLRPIVTYKVRR